MKKTIVSFVRGALNDQRGQILPWVAVVLVGMMGMAGMSIDVGRAYVVHSQLQNIANAAALAAAGNIYNTGTTDNANTIATEYSAATGGENTNVGVGVASPVISQRCLNMLMPSGTTCGTGSPNNAVQVKESASVPTYFMSLFGFSSLNVSATALAAKGAAQPWNVAVIVDSTGSMNVADSNCGSVTEFQCALNGVQVLLGGTDPTCPTNPITCPTGYDFQVALFTFPNLLTSYNGALPSVSGTTFDSQSLDINCGGTPGSYTNWKTQPLAAPYTLPIPGATLPTDSEGRVYMTYTQTSTSKQWNASYQITPFLHDYYNASSSSTGYLNTSSDIVKAVGYGSTKGCLTYTFGIDGSTGSGSGFGNTYFASSIYEAEAALSLQKAANPNALSAIIFLSDGQANASYWSKNKTAYGSSPYYNSTNQYNEATEFPEAPASSEVGPTTTSYPVPPYYTPATASNSSLGYSLLGANGKGYYPDWYDQCQQTVAAAQYALNSNGNGATGNFKVDRFYAVAYGAETSGCSNGWSVGTTDTSSVLTGTLNVPVSGTSILPCTTMENMAGDGSSGGGLKYFYSDNQQTGNVNSACADNVHPTVSLSQIFQAIAASMTVPRLLPNNAQ